MINQNTRVNVDRHRHGLTLLLRNLYFSLLFLAILAGGLYLSFLFLGTMRVLIGRNSASTVAAHPEVKLPTQPPVITPAPAMPVSVPEPTPPPPVWEKGRVNILLLGIDQRACEDTGGAWRTDTMILVSLDPETRQASVLSFPRDLWVQIPTVGPNRLNAAHFFGDAYNYPGGGPALAKRTIYENFGVPVHYYVRINFDGFKKAIDALGGIEIDVQEPIWDDRYPTDDCGYQTIQFDVGRHHFNGEQALQYARSRHYTSDFDRARRQQQVLFAIYDKVTSLEILPRLPELWSAKGEMVQTDLSLLDAMKLARLGMQVDRANIHYRVIDESMTRNMITEKGWQVLDWDREKVGALIQELFGVTTLSE